MSGLIEIALADHVVRARLLSDLAPETCRAVSVALPFSGRAVHATLSGDMFRLLEPAPLPDLPLEAKTSFMYPGLVAYYPPIHELAICYGEARFTNFDHPLPLTPFAEIEGDLDGLADLARRLTTEGAKPLELRAAPADAPPFRPATHDGRRLEFEFGGVRHSATLLETRSPQTAAALAAALPLDGRFTNDTWGGQLTHIPGPDLESPPTEATTSTLWPGWLYWSPERSELSFCYGSALLLGPREGTSLVPVAVLDDGWESVRRRAGAQLLEGSMPATLALAS